MDLEFEEHLIFEDLGVGSRKGCEEGGHCVLLRVIGGIYVLISWFCKDLGGC
jgi:hypothetical protein